MTYKRFFWRVGRTVLLYGWFIGLSVLMAALLEIGLLPQIRAVLSWGTALVLWIGSAVLSFFALYSCLHQFALNDTVHYRAFSESMDIASKPRWRDAARATVKSPAFLCETVVLVAMIMGLPTGAGWAGLGALAETYLPLPRVLSRLLIGALVSVIGTALNLSAHISAEANWRLDARAAAMKQGSVGGKRAMAPGWRRLLLYAFFVSLGYAFLCLAGPMVVFAVGGVFDTLAGFLSRQVAAVFVGLFLLLLAHRYLRALRAPSGVSKKMFWRSAARRATPAPAFRICMVPSFPGNGAAHFRLSPAGNDTPVASPAPSGGETVCSSPEMTAFMSTYSGCSNVLCFVVITVPPSTSRRTGNGSSSSTPRRTRLWSGRTVSCGRE